MAAVKHPQPPPGESRAPTPPPSTPASTLGAAIVALLFCAGMLQTPGQVRGRGRTSKTNPTADREDYHLTVNGLGRALTTTPPTSRGAAGAPGESSGERRVTRQGRNAR